MHKSHRVHHVTTLVSAEKTRLSTVCHRCDSLSQQLAQLNVQLAQSAHDHGLSAQAAKLKVQEVIAQLKAALDQEQARLLAEIDAANTVSNPLLCSACLQI